MTALNFQSIEDKLFRLDAHIRIIEGVLVHTDKEIIDESTLYYTLEHMLQLNIQIILDIGAHILAEQFHENPKTYAEVIVELGTHGVVTKEFAASQEGMAEFRNKLVHDYDLIDKTKTVRYGRVAPQEFRSFGKAFTDFIEKQK